MKPLLTDLYQLTMDAAYMDNNKDDTATFELFIRSLPTDWAYFIANGVEEAIDYATTLKFSDDDINGLKEHTKLPTSYIDSLKDFKFEGDIYAVKEGTPVFPNEPILRITGKRSQVQLLETTLLNIINYQTMIASKASRVVSTAHTALSKASVVDFGLRRAQGEDAGIKGARAAYIGGAVGTSNVAAGIAYNIPIVGTHAHSFVMSFDSELEAFRAYVKTFPDNATLLIDTYDTVEGAKNATIVAKELEQSGHKLGAVRIDSGDIADLAHKVRSVLNKEGLYSVKILASNDLNEYKIEELIRKSAPIDGFGVGTEMITAKPTAAISGVYKLVEDEQGPKMKFSTGKKSYPGKHQVYRITGKDEHYSHDVIALDGEKIEGSQLLELAVKNGIRIRAAPDLEEIRSYALKEVAKLPERIRGTKNYSPYNIRESPGLQKLIEALSEKVAA